MNTTRQQRVEFISELRDNYDGNGRLRISSNRARTQVAQLLIDIENDLIAMTRAELGKPLEMCQHCNVVLTNDNRVNYASANNQILVTRDDHVCEGCLKKMIERSAESTVGVP